MNPKAKINILVEELAEETLVMDLDRHRAHCLNPTAAFLLQEADGERNVEELRRMAGESFGVPATQEAILLGLERLSNAHLVEWDGPSGAPSGPTRRQAIRKIATMGLVLPAVMTIVTPAAAQGTGISPSQCRTADDLGKCCNNHKTCIMWMGKIRCKGARC